MIVNEGALKAVFSGFSTAYHKGFTNAKPHYTTVATIVPSGAEEENYAWFGNLPKMREWIGERIVNNFIAHSYVIKNKKFELTIEVARTKIEDDKYGVFGPMFEEMGRSTALYPDEQVLSLLPAGFSSLCYDGQYFFDPDHPAGVNDQDGVVSNMQAGDGPAWYLLDCSRAIKPLVFQERLKPKFTRLDNDNDPNVFWRDEYVYGARARGNAGYGLWQMAFASKATLDADNFEAAVAAMTSLKDERGKPLGIMPNVLVVPASLQGAAKRLMNGQRIVVVNNTPVAIANEWAGTVETIVSPWL